MRETSLRVKSYWDGGVLIKETKRKKLWLRQRNQISNIVDTYSLQKSASQVTTIFVKRLLIFACLFYESSFLLQILMKQLQYISHHSKCCVTKTISLHSRAASFPNIVKANEKYHTSLSVCWSVCLSLCVSFFMAHVIFNVKLLWFNREHQRRGEEQEPPDSHGICFSPLHCAFQLQRSNFKLYFWTPLKLEFWMWHVLKCGCTETWIGGRQWPRRVCFATKNMSGAEGPLSYELRQLCSWKWPVEPLLFVIGYVSKTCDSGVSFLRKILSHLVSKMQQNHSYVSTIFLFVYLLIYLEVLWNQAFEYARAAFPLSNMTDSIYIFIIILELLPQNLLFWPLQLLTSI